MSSVTLEWTIKHRNFVSRSDSLHSKFYTSVDHRKGKKDEDVAVPGENENWSTSVDHRKDKDEDVAVSGENENWSRRGT